MSFPISSPPPGFTPPLTAAPAESPVAGRFAGGHLTQVAGPGAAIHAEAGGVAHVDSGPSNLPLSGRLQQVLGEVADGSPRIHDRLGRLEDRLATKDSLMRLVGHAPQKDRLGGLWSMSTQYKAVLTHLDQYHTGLSGKIPDDPAAAREQAAQQVEQLGASLLAADKYIAQHAGNPAKGQAVAAMQTLQEQLRQEISLLNTVASRVGTHGDLAGMTWKQSLAGAGYRMLDSIAQNNDARLNHELSRENAGSGAVNTVAKLVYGEGEAIRETFFKTFPAEETNEDVSAQVLKPMGIKPENPCYAARNVAMAFVSEAFQLNSVVHCGFALHQETLGIAMDAAPGASTVTRVPLQAVPPPRMEHLLQGMSLAELKQNGYQQLRADEGPTAHWVLTAPKAEISAVTRGDAALKASLLQGSNALEWTDGFAAQRDRHDDNVHFKVENGTVVVTGIDNDFSWPDMAHSLAADAVRPERERVLTFGIGLPQLIDAAFAERLIGANFDRDLKPTLSTLLPPEAVTSAAARFAELQGHAAALQAGGLAVGDWQTWTHPATGQSAEAFLLAQDSGSSYYARAVARETADQQTFVPQPNGFWRKRPELTEDQASIIRQAPGLSAEQRTAATLALRDAAASPQQTVTEALVRGLPAQGELCAELLNDLTQAGLDGDGAYEALRTYSSALNNTVRVDLDGTGPELPRALATDPAALTTTTVSLLGAGLLLQPDLGPERAADLLQQLTRPGQGLTEVAYVAQQRLSRPMITDGASPPEALERDQSERDRASHLLDVSQHLIRTLARLAGRSEAEIARLTGEVGPGSVSLKTIRAAHPDAHGLDGITLAGELDTAATHGFLETALARDLGRPVRAETLGPVDLERVRQGELPLSFKGFPADLSAAGLHKAAHFSDGFLEDFFRRGITIDGEHIPASGTQRGAPMEAALDRLVAKFPSLAEAGRVTRPLYQGFSADLTTALARDPSSQEAMTALAMNQGETVTDRLSFAITSRPGGEYGVEAEMGQQKSNRRSDGAPTDPLGVCIRVSFTIEAPGAGAAAPAVLINDLDYAFGRTRG